MISATKMASTNEEKIRISKGLYTNHAIGQEYVVRSRRQQYDLPSFLFHNEAEYTCFISGSRAEGFHFKSSDIDAMLIHRTVLVIDSELRMVSKNVCFPIHFLMENDNAPPGFTLLKCIRYVSRTDDPDIDETLVIRGDSKYMSSKGAQQIHLMYRNTTSHGPCRKGTMYGIEYDLAYTLICPFWPKQAHSFIHRSIHKGWPTTDELRDICKEGCLLVPIDSKQSYSSDHADLEWRISFSLAEKKLVYSMNHCQFLCNGLMKIFLNEVLKEIPETDTETGNVLCSYFKKTAVFWEISENVNDWSTRDFLNRFLNVFHRVIRWVEEGYCPNFFIPEQNMFYGKIYGRRQRELMFRLRSLYDEGIMCLSHFEPLGNIYYLFY
ncbi:hypothetical protein FSP39_018144 [Pinctada imbricata]|uniref:Mab-21-like nucleotidyltransferase domain-containing protein n=1 Tax=Pinctada imbricata TaxID=66713 RepID=A0AA89BXL7_PINIB|nr:hypothetical protein FSP39_018144 [Pinctada imbricata]